MAKNDFDFNFDAANEDDFDPTSFLGSDAFDEDMDFSDFSDDESDLNPDSHSNRDRKDDDSDEDFNFDDLNLDTDFELDDFPGEEEDQPQHSDSDYEEESEDADSEEFDYDQDSDESEFPEEFDEAPFSDGFDDAGTSEDSDEENNTPEKEQDEDMNQEEWDEEGKPHRSQKKKKKKKTPVKISLPPLKMPNFFQKFLDVYFAPILNKEMREIPADPSNPRRRRKKSPIQIFKEVYLPPIIACLCLILVLSFAIGSISNLIAEKRLENERKQSHLQSSESAAQLEEQRIAQLVQDAADFALRYDYDKAIETLRSVGDLNTHPEIAAKVSEYITIQSQLQEHKDPSLIPNLSFNLLIEDMVRAKAHKDYGGLYNKNFVTTGEFRKILEQLYSNGYVLVDFNSFTSSQTDASGNEVFMDKPILLPNGKKPIMITETLVNYFNYMIDGNDDKTPDAQGSGFAYKLVVQNGEIKAMYVDANGQTLTGDYDLVPILETFIQEHPDFSYRGARAILAVTGYEGIFGYRITSDYISSKGQDYVNQEIADCKVLVDALRAKGYTIACNTFKNLPYGQKSVAEITADLQSWEQQIVPVLGRCNVFVFVKNSPISSYSDAAFQALYSKGFRYFVAEGSSPWAEVNTTYVRQNRILVSGNTMAWKTTNFTSPTMIFDPAAVLDITNRGQVPN